MRQTTFLLLSTILLSSTVYAGGHIFGSKHKSSNPYGVYAINVHVCSDLECPPVRIVEGDCTGEHMSLHWGVCVCDEGYVASGDYCDPDGSGSSGGGASGPTVEEDETADSCPTGSSTTFSVADATTKLVDSSRCYCTNATPVWDGTRCIEPSSTKVCNSSTPCGSGEYCRYKGASGLSCYSNTSGYPVTGSGSSTEVNGTCEKVAGVKKTTDSKFYYSATYMDWFSAKSWCEAIGKNLVKLSTLEASPYKCSTDDVTCDNFDAFVGLETAQYYWTDICSNNTSGCDSESCHVFYIAVGDQEFGPYYSRNSSFVISPLCE